MRYIQKYIDEGTQDTVDEKGYNCDESKLFIETVYEHSCAYCGGRPEATSSSQIEHFYEKVDYPNLTTDLHNLHYSCQNCNRLKENYKKIRPVLSPNYYLDCIEEQHSTSCGRLCRKTCTPKWKEYQNAEIDKRLKYSGHLIFASKKDIVANNTINLFDLNNEMKHGRSARGSLVNDRLTVYCYFTAKIKIVYNCLNELHQNPSCTTKDLLWKIIDNEMREIVQGLKGRYQLPYTKMLTDNYSKSIIQLLLIVKHVKTK